MTGQPFDWVTERSKCSLEAVFQHLRLGVQHDVDTRQALREKGEFGYEVGFTFASNGGRFSVSARTHDSNRSATFTLQAGRVWVTDESGEEIVSAVVTITDSGECRLLTKGGLELEEWQFRKRALESLFFLESICDKR